MEVKEIMEKILSKDNLFVLYEDYDMFKEELFRGVCTEGFEFKNIKGRCANYYKGIMNPKKGKTYKVKIGDSAVFKAKFVCELQSKLLDDIKLSFEGAFENLYENYFVEYLIFEQTIKNKKEYLIFYKPCTEIKRRTIWGNKR